MYSEQQILEMAESLEALGVEVTEITLSVALYCTYKFGFDDVMRERPITPVNYVTVERPMVRVRFR